MTIVIVDSGVAERFTECNRIDFPICNEESVPPVAFGHGTAVYHIIHKKCSSFAEIINFRIINIENNIGEDVLIDALHYIDMHLQPDIINLSLGISVCGNKHELYSACLALTEKGVTIVSAFDNTGSISYPAAFQNVIGVVSGSSCSKVDDFEYYEDEMVNIGAKGNLQRLVWDQSPFAFLSGNSFACAHVTAKIAEMIYLEGKRIPVQTILNKFSQIAIQNHHRLNQFIRPKLPFTIHNAVIFPFSKEMHSLLRYEHLLDFKIAAVYDTKYSAKIASNTRHFMNDNQVNQYAIKNIDKLDYSSFDTFILGHMSELTSVLNDKTFVVKLIDELLHHGKNIFSFDDISNYGISPSKNIYFPHITKENVPPFRLGMLHRITTPVLGIFGTSSKQGKFTLQLKLRELLVTNGYSVGAVGTEPTAELYGMEYVFPMGYNSTVYIDAYDTVSYLNTALYDMSTRKKDLIIVGSQSGTIPYDYGNMTQFPMNQYHFLLGTLPDGIVLCVNLFDSLEYIQRTIHFLESSINSKVLALATLPFAAHNHSNGLLEVSKKLMSYNDFLETKKYFHSQFDIPLYSIASDEDMDELMHRIIDFF